VLLLHPEDVEAKVRARSEGRKVRDGEFTTACAQTCPAGVLTFGNLLTRKAGSPG
jgi:molybdopterin-containing oxidoreductase family iron-sulfur binding subunit